MLGLLLVLFLLLLLDRNSLSNQVEKRETALKEEQATNIVLGNIIDADQANEAANRAATARQLENERKLRNESDARLKRFQAAAAGDLCADSQLPDDVVSLLRE
ncbi:DUF2570 domain-containing protein [Yersinia ruckeri]|nr:DUF2570 domain-containing protein [Yersinia ruckeri]OIX35931.1 DUF2570 domain-containing protein [Yersinia ruckeri]OIX36068.1 DUF2570 domain-containing protein [Yersinia ruckeri]OIX46301.1 DUF2570 domain-containing protein [Yersinia ruckeri]OIX46677.1 DUF2570 domain-containing protein [Yersinia ruckeri]